MIQHANGLKEPSIWYRARASASGRENAGGERRQEGAGGGQADHWVMDSAPSRYTDDLPSLAMQARPAPRHQRTSRICLFVGGASTGRFVKYICFSPFLWKRKLITSGFFSKWIDACARKQTKVTHYIFIQNSFTIIQSTSFKEYLNTIKGVCVSTIATRWSVCVLSMRVCFIRSLRGS